MASSLEHVYSTAGNVRKSAIRDELSGVADDDLSKSSPVTAGCEEVGLSIERRDGKTVVVARVEGHDGDWTKTSEDAVRRAILRAPGVDDLSSRDGGYEP